MGLGRLFLHLAFLISFYSIPSMADSSKPGPCDINRFISGLFSKKDPSPYEIRFIAENVLHDSKITLERGGAKEVFLSLLGAGKNTVVDPARVEKQRNLIMDSYFDYLKSKRGFLDERIQSFKNAEMRIPEKDKIWVGVYDRKSKQITGAIRFVQIEAYRSKKLEEDILPLELVLKDRGLDFKVADLYRDQIRPNEAWAVSEAGRAFRLDGEQGEDAR